MPNKKQTFGEIFSNIETKNVQDQKLSTLIDAGAYQAKIKALYFSKGKDSNAMGFSAEVHIESEDKTLYVRNVNFVKKDGDANSIGLSQLKTFLKAVDDEWDNEDKDFIGVAEIGETTRLTKDKKPYTVQEFTNAIDADVAALVEVVKEGENGTPYNRLKMVANLNDKKTIEAFKELVEKTPVKVIKPRDGESSSGMKTGDNKKATSAASKL